MEFWQAFTTIRKRWLLITALAILATALAGAVVLVQPRVYISTTTINTGASQTADWYATSLRLADMQAVILSNNLLSKMNDQVHLDKPMSDIVKAIKVTRIADSGVLRIDVSWNDPQKAQKAASVLTDLFIDYQNGQLKAQAQRDLQKLEEQLQLSQDRLQRAEQSQPATTTTSSTDPIVRASQEELVAARQNYYQTVNQLETARATANNSSSGNLTSVIDAALIPPQAEPNNLLRTLVFGFLMGAFTGIVLAVAIEYLNSLPRLINLLRNRLQTPILTVIPWERHFRKAYFPTKLTRPRKEAYRQLGANILVSGIDDNLDSSDWRDTKYQSVQFSQSMSLLVVAEKNGAGTSSVAANTAIALARSGQKVLLLEANLIDPSLDRFLHETASQGLSDWLQEPDRPVEEFFTPTAEPNLVLLAAGNNPEAGRDLLMRRNLDQLLKKLSSFFNFIIVDSPARTTSGDSLLLAKVVKGIIVVIKPQGHKDEEHAREAVQFAGDKLIGVVINGAKVESGLATSQFARPVIYNLDFNEDQFQPRDRDSIISSSLLDGTKTRR